MNIKFVGGFLFAAALLMPAFSSAADKADVKAGVETDKAGVETGKADVETGKANVKSDAVAK